MVFLHGHHMSHYVKYLRPCTLTPGKLFLFTLYHTWMMYMPPFAYSTEGQLFLTICGIWGICAITILCAITRILQLCAIPNTFAAVVYRRETEGSRMEILVLCCMSCVYSMYITEYVSSVYWKLQAYNPSAGNFIL